MMSDEIQIDNYDKDDLYTFKGHIYPQEMTSDEDNLDTQEELLQQE